MFAKDGVVRANVFMARPAAAITAHDKGELMRMCSSLVIIIVLVLGYFYLFAV